MESRKCISIYLYSIFLATQLCLCGCTSINTGNDIRYSQGLLIQRQFLRSVFGSFEGKGTPQTENSSDTKNKSIVDASFFGFNSDDSTKNLQAAFDSGARFILIPKMDTPWISEQLYIRSNTTVILEEGTEIVAKRGSFLGASDSLVTINDAENVTIFGYNAILRMYKEDYRKAPYTKGEWRHTVNINGSKNINIYGLKMEKSGGDGIYLGRGKIFYNENINIKDVRLIDNYRQGISVISAQHLYITDAEISNTEGTPPSAGIDFEPNLADERLVDCVVNRCVITGNAGSGILIYLEKQDQSSIPFSISILNCSIERNLASILLWGTGNNVSGELRLSENYITGITWIPESIKNIKITNELN